MSEKINASLIPDNAITEISGKIYDDVAHKSLSQVGDVSESLMKLVFLPFKCLGMTVDELEKKYQYFIKKTINKVPQDKLVKPDPLIASKILEHVKYVFTEDMLVEMFSNLLASDMNIDSKSKIHSSFVDTLSKMNTFDAKIILFIYYHKQIVKSSLSFFIKDPEQHIYFQDISMITTADIDQWYISSYFLKSSGILEIFQGKKINYVEFTEKLMGYGNEFIIPKIVEDFFKVKAETRKKLGSKSSLGIHAIMGDKLTSLLDTLKNRELNSSSFTMQEKTYLLSDYGNCFIKCCINTELEEYLPESKVEMAINYLHEQAII